MKLASLRLITLSLLVICNLSLWATPDIGVSKIISPISNCGLSSSDSIRVEVTNYGSDPVTSFGLFFSINGAVSSPELVSESLLSGESLEYTFVATGDFSAAGTIDLEAWTLISADADPSNDLDAVSLAVLPIVYMPLEDDFDGYVPTTSYFPDYSNDPSADIDFEVIYGATSSGGTGPADDVTAGGGYIYMESTGFAAGSKAILRTACIDLSTGISPSLIYSYHMFGDGIGSLTVDLISGSHSVRLSELVGQQQAADTDPWLSDSIDLSAFLGYSVQIVFTGTIGTTGTSYHSDIALDEIYVTDPQLDDVGIVYQNGPAAACNLSTSEQITVTIENFGANDQTGFDIGYTVDGPTGLYSSLENIGAGVVSAGGLYTHTFITEVDLSLSGAYKINLFTSLPGDIAIGNDTLANDFVINSVSFPHQEAFDGFPDGYSDFDEFVNAPIADMPFLVSNGPTPSPATGPIGDFDGTGGYIFMESTGAAAGDRAVLRTSCIDLDAGANAEMIFAYHMFGDGIGLLRVDVSDGSTVTTVSELIGQQQVSATEEWKTDTIDLSPWAGQSIQVTFRGEVGTTGSPSNSDIALDDIGFSYVFSTDVGCAAVVSPETGCSLGSAEIIETEVENFGVTPATGFDINYSVTGPGGTVNFTENVGGFSVPAGGSSNYSFTMPADFSANGIYDVAVWTSLAGDLGPLNDSAFAMIENQAGVAVVVSPWSEDFDSYPDGTTVFLTMENDLGVPIQFQAIAGPTLSTGTGPDTDASGTGSYIYMETSGAFVGDQARICSECLDLTGTTSPQVEFGYHMFGLSVGSLVVEVLAGDSSTVVSSFTGPTHFAGSDPWLFGNGDLSPWINTDVQVCFTGEVGTGGFTFESDIALDEISVRELSPSDVGAASVLSPVLSGCSSSASETITVGIENFGTTPQTGFDVTYELTGPGGLQTSTENIGAVVIQPDSILVFSFASTVDLSAFGIYSLCVYTELAGDLSTGNDTICVTLENTAPISTFPWTEDFETFGVCGTGCGADCSDFVANEWVQDGDDDTDWLTDAGGTPSTGTGPIVDAVPGTSVGQYLYTEASGCNDNTSNLISPCFDISALAVPGLKFQYYMLGDDMGEMFVDVTTDGGMLWTNVWSRAGQDQVVTTDPWKEVTIPLGGFTGIINFRFRGKTGPIGFESDMAIDAVTVLDIPPFDDLEVIDYVEIEPNCTLDPAEVITITIRNSGTDPLSGFNVGYDISGPIPTSAMENVGALVINPGNTADYTFTTTADLTADGTYALEAFVLLGSDAIGDNDTLRALIVNVPTLAFPTVDDFNSYPDGATIFDFLENDPTAELQYEVNFGGTTSTGTGPDDDASGGGGYIYMETSGSAVGDSARVISYCVDLVGTTNPRVEFSYHMFGLSIDRLTTYVIIDTTYTILDSLVGQKHTSSGAAWLTRLLDLTPFTGQTIRVAFEGVVGTGGSTFESDIAIDEVKLRDPLTNDLSADAALSPSNNCMLMDEVVTFELSNPGITSQMNFNVSFSVDGGTAVTELVTDTLDEGEQMIYTFATPADLSAEGWHTIAIWTDLALDDNLFNDTVLLDVLHVPLLDSFPYVQDFEVDPIYWAAEGENSSWEMGLPGGAVINSAASGTNSWATSLNGPYNLSEQSAVVSPCFDFSTLDRPGVLLSIWWDSEAGITVAFDGAVLQTSVDGGVVWRNVGAFGDPDNWFNANNIVGNPGEQTPGLPFANGWSGDGFDGSGGWLIAQHELDGLGGEDNVKLRVAFGSDASIAADGFAFDDVIIADMPSVSLGPDSSVCSGFLLDAGNAGATYNWSTGESTQTIVVTTTGLYSVTVTDSYGFKATDEVLLTVVPGPTVDLGPDGLICDPIMLDAENPGASYSWSTGEITQMITVYTTGTYIVEVTDPTSLCVGSDEIMVELGAEPVASFTSSVSGATVDFTDGSTGGSTYSWIFGDGNASTDPNPTHSYGMSGNYLVTLIVTNACGSDTTFGTVVVIASGLDDPMLNATMSLYPNPTGGLVFLEVAAGDVGDALIGVFNTAGQVVLMEELVVPSPDSWTYNLDLSHLAKGNYLIKFAINGRQASKMLTIE